MRTGWLSEAAARIDIRAATCLYGSPHDGRSRDSYDQSSQGQRGQQDEPAQERDEAFEQMLNELD